MARKTRSLAQIAASRGNGSKSRGPTTPEGRAVAAMNSASHGVFARQFLAADESVEDYEKCVEAWHATLHPSTSALVMLANRVADVAFRLGRLKRLEEHVQDVETESQLAKSETAKRLAAVLLALEGLRALAELAENVTEPVEGGDAAKLFSGMRRICNVAEQAEAPVSVLLPLSESVDAFAVAVATQIEVDAFRAVARACREAELCLSERRADLQQEIQLERESLALTVAFSDSKTIKQLDRYESRLNRELQAALDAYEKARTLASNAPSSGPLGEVPEVELRLVGPAARRA